jgi:hypothetical protein
LWRVCQFISPGTLSRKIKRRNYPCLNEDRQSLIGDHLNSAK